MRLEECRLGLTVRDRLDGEVGTITRIDYSDGIVWVGQRLANGTIGECDFDPLDLERSIEVSSEPKSP